MLERPKIWKRMYWQTYFITAKGHKLNSTWPGGVCSQDKIKRTQAQAPSCLDLSQTGLTIKIILSIYKPRHILKESILIEKTSLKTWAVGKSVGYCFLSLWYWKAQSNVVGGPCSTKKAGWANYGNQGSKQHSTSLCFSCCLEPWRSHLPAAMVFDLRVVWNKPCPPRLAFDHDALSH